MIFKDFRVLVPWTKVVSALRGSIGQFCITCIGGGRKAGYVLAIMVNYTPVVHIPRTLRGSASDNTESSEASYWPKITLPV